MLDLSLDCIVMMDSNQPSLSVCLIFYEANESQHDQRMGQVAKYSNVSEKYILDNFLPCVNFSSTMVEQFGF